MAKNKDNPHVHADAGDDRVGDAEPDPRTGLHLRLPLRHRLRPGIALLVGALGASFEEQQYFRHIAYVDEEA